MEVKFATKMNSTTILKSKEEVRLPTNKGIRTAFIYMSRAPLELTPELLVAAVLTSTEENPEIMLVMEKTNNLNRGLRCGNMTFCKV